MRRIARGLLVAVAVAALSLAGLPGPAGALPDDGLDHDPRGEPGSSTSRTSTSNMHALGHSAHPAQFDVAAEQRHINSDLAFWGYLAIQGNYGGFGVVDISAPGNPKLLSQVSCNGDEGDVVIWDTIVVRSWDTPAPPGRRCAGQLVPVGFEGVHVFDISDPSEPELLGEVALECGSHTLTAAGVVEGRLIVYSNNSSSLRCVDGARASDDPAGDFMDILSVPLAEPGRAELVRREPLAGPAANVRTGCHDAGVILGTVNKAACASADTINVWDIGANETPGGSPEHPQLLFTISEPGVGQSGTDGRWHSAAFTWDGKVIAAGSEPGGGLAAQCEQDDPFFTSMFFYDADTGAKLGQWTLPRAQSAGENCTLHNFNVVPLRSGRYVTVGGYHEAGTWAVDFTDPADATPVAYSDPDVLTPADVAGAWASYQYNGSTYESDIQKGLNVFMISGNRLAGEVRLPYLNPQTQDPTLLGTGRRR